MKRFAAPALGLALFAALALWLGRFDPGVLLDAAAPAPPPRKARPRAAAPVWQRALRPDSPLSAAPEIGSPGKPVLVRCRADGSLAGALSLSLRWSARDGPERVVPMEVSGAGVFTASVIPGPTARGLRLVCFDPERPASPGWAGAVHLAVPAALARLPRFDRARPSARVHTAAVDAAQSIGSGAVSFDRLSESAGLRYYWRSSETGNASSEGKAAALDGAIGDLRAYLGVEADRAKPPIYVKACPSCLGHFDPRANYGQATRDAVIVETDDAAVVATAVHELTHYFTPDVEHCTTRPALCEGLAVFAAAAYAGRLGALQEDALRALGPSEGLGLLDLDAERFYGPDDVSGLYSLSGSLVLDLVERHGARPVLAALGGAPIEKAFGRPRTQLEAEWRAALRGP